MARQSLKPKRKRDATWFRDKVLLVEAQRSGKVLNEEELEFLVDLRVEEGPVTQTVITHNAAYQADDLDVYDFNCDDFSTAKAVLMANLSSYRSDVLSKVVQIVLWYLDSGCSKHMTKDRSQLTNFVHKFLGTVKVQEQLFSVGQLCDSDVEVAFRKHTCFVRNLEVPSQFCLYLKPQRPNRWLWALGTDCPLPMCIASINGKKYILVIGDDYSWFTWVKFLASKDEAPYFIIKFLMMVQSVGISHETSVARSPQQNGVVERRNRTLVEAARTMLIYAKAPLFLWAEAVATELYFTICLCLIRRDTPSMSIPSSQDQEHSPIISQGFKESPKTPHFHDDPLHESLHEDSTSQGSSSNVRPIHTPFESLGRWTKDHPIGKLYAGNPFFCLHLKENYRLMPCGVILMPS
ncbi:retrovirus-related pol polyprotein from transposon TNT 1-94 [Tanacetum coccineum]